MGAGVERWRDGETLCYSRLGPQGSVLGWEEPRVSPVKVCILIKAVKVPRSRPPELTGSECENMQGQTNEGNTQNKGSHSQLQL